MEKEILKESITEELVMDKENLEEIIEVGCDCCDDGCEDCQNFNYVKDGYEQEFVEDTEAHELLKDVAEAMIKRFGEERFEDKILDNEGNVIEKTININFEDEEIKKAFDEEMENILSKDAEAAARYGGTITGGNTLLGSYSFPQFMQIHNTPGTYTVYSAPTGGSVIGALYEKEIFLCLGVSSSYTRNMKIYFMKSSGAMSEGYINTKQHSRSGINAYVSNNHYLGIVNISGIYRPYWRISENMNLYNGNAVHVKTIYANHYVAGSLGATSGDTRKHWMRICGWSVSTTPISFLTEGDNFYMNTGLATKPNSPYIYGQPGRY